MQKMQKRTAHKNKLFQFLCSHIAKNPSLKCTYFFTQSSNTNTLLHTPLSPTQYGPIFYQDVKRLYVWAGHLPVFGKTLLLKTSGLE